MGNIPKIRIGNNEYWLKDQEAREAIANSVVLKAGEHQVKPQNIYGVTYTKTTTDVPGPNIFSSSYLFESGYYASINTSVSPQVIAHNASSSYNTYCIPVDGVSKYSFTKARFVALALGNAIGSLAVGTLGQNITEITTTGATYMFLSISSSTSISNIEVHKVTTTSTYTNLEMPAWSGIPNLQLRVDELEHRTGSNLFNQAELLSDEGYATVNASTGKMTIMSNGQYSAYLLPVDGESTYTFTNCRFALLINSDKETVIGDPLENVLAVDSTGASYIAFSFNHNSYPTSTYVARIAKITDDKPQYLSATGNLSNGSMISLENCRNGLRKGERIVFKGNVSSFSSIEIGLTNVASPTESQRFNAFVIDGTNISYYSQRGTSTPTSEAHGLTISNNLQVIWEKADTNHCNITIVSNGEIFQHEFVFTRNSSGYPYVLSSSTSMTSCKLIWTCVDLDKPIWMFGDSYFSYGNTRWTYYLHQYGYDKNCLIDGFAGQGSVNGNVAFKNLLRFGSPKFAVWCLGMNDGSDDSSTPSESWVTNRDLFLNYCKNNDVIPVFGTIPSVPSVRHEQKNAWIRGSGYRYIDFAAAVGANANGIWYTGMLSDDQVHPSVNGARALFAQVLADLPEIMIES